MLSNLLIFFGIVTGAIGLLDVFLSDAQKKLIDDWLLRFWNRLDELKRYPLAEMLKQGDAWRLSSGILFGVVFLASIMNAIIHDPRPDSVNWLGPSGVATAALLLFVVYFWSTLVANGVGWLIRSLAPGKVSWLFWTVPVLAAGLIALAFALMAASYYLIVFGVVFLMVGAASGLLWIFAATPLVAIHLASATIGALEFVVRRLVEYPKGSLLAVSAAIAAAGGLLRSSGM